MLTDVIVEDNRWAEAGLAALSERAATQVLDHLNLSAAAFEIAVLGCDDVRISGLNAAFRDKPGPTNVLSWPSADLAPNAPGDAPLPPESEDKPHHLGDLAIAYETCEREAAEQTKTFEAHVIHLLVHGVLHLLGYDHIRDADATVMEQQEREILGKLGFPDPYRVIEGPRGL